MTIFDMGKNTCNEFDKWKIYVIDPFGNYHEAMRARKLEAEKQKVVKRFKQDLDDRSEIVEAEFQDVAEER